MVNAVPAQRAGLADGVLLTIDEQHRVEAQVAGAGPLPNGRAVDGGFAAVSAVIVAFHEGSVVLVVRVVCRAFVWVDEERSWLPVCRLSRSICFTCASLETNMVAATCLQLPDTGQVHELLTGR